jgi:hypothetical protein
VESSKFSHFGIVEEYRYRPISPVPRREVVGSGRLSNVCVPVDKEVIPTRSAPAMHQLYIAPTGVESMVSIASTDEVHSEKEHTED